MLPGALGRLWEWYEIGKQMFRKHRQSKRSGGVTFCVALRKSERQPRTCYAHVRDERGAGLTSATVLQHPNMPQSAGESKKCRATCCRNVSKQVPMSGKCEELPHPCWFSQAQVSHDNPAGMKAPYS